MKVLFLDVDGVLNRDPGDDRTTLLVGAVRGYYLEPECCRELARVTREAGAVVVVTSVGWRSNDPGKRGVSRRWFLRMYLATFGVMVYDETYRPAKGSPRDRGEAVADWIRGHSTLYAWAAVDDVDEYLPEQRQSLVLTDERYGLTAADADRLIEILGAQGEEVGRG